MHTPPLQRPWRLLQGVFSRPGPGARQAATAPAAATPPETPERGCGWFDSSLDLQQGLRVQEHADPALADLPLEAWLALQLQGWRCEAPAVLSRAASCRRHPGDIPETSAPPAAQASSGPVLMSEDPR